MLREIESEPAPSVGVLWPPDPSNAPEDAWGNLEIGASEPGYAFTGREWDPETGLYYYRARYYMPSIGRFLSEDPAGGVDGPNLYAYVGNRPVNLTDPLGLYSMDEFIYDAAQFSAGMGDNLSFGLTSLVRDGMGTNDLIDKGSGLYASGEFAGTGVGLAFGAAHLGRNALYQANGRLARGVGRVACDRRTWGATRRMWSRAAGGLRSKGQSLHHWLIPRRAGEVNAGFNYLPISAGLNSWMNGQTAAALAVEWGMKGAILGIYGSTVPGARIDSYVGN